MSIWDTRVPLEMLADDGGMGGWRVRVVERRDVPLRPTTPDDQAERKPLVSMAELHSPLHHLAVSTPSLLPALPSTYPRPFNHALPHEYPPFTAHRSPPHG